MIALLIGAATAGPVVLVLAGAQVPLELGTASVVGPAGGLAVGWQLEHWRPEALVHLGMGAPVGVVRAGAAWLTEGDGAVGAAAHVGMPWVGGYPVPTVDVGAVGEWHLGAFLIGARAGYAFASTVHAKCGACPQPGHHFGEVHLSLGWAP